MSDTVERVVPGDLSWEEYGFEHMQRYEFFREHYSGKTILDAACGSGYGSEYIAQQNATSVLGIDISDEAINFASRNYSKSNLNYKKEDCSDLGKFENQFDLILSFETIEHLNDPGKFIASAAKALKQGGRFICSTPNKERLSGAGHLNPFHLKELTWNEFRIEMEKHFTIEHCYEQTETLSYQRYQELKFLIEKSEGRSNWYIFPRIENFFRRLFKKEFKKPKYMNPNLGFLNPGDMEINVLNKPEVWHKTFIINAVKR